VFVPPENVILYLGQIQRGLYLNTTILRHSSRKVNAAFFCLSFFGKIRYNMIVSIYLLQAGETK